MQIGPGEFLQPWLKPLVPWLYVNSYWWTALGFAGNILFGSRFLLQWLSSEKERRVVVPAYFWHLSFWGSVLNLIYAFHIDNAPILLGVMFLPFIYGRNLILLRRNGERALGVRTSTGEKSIQPKFHPA